MILKHARNDLGQITNEFCIFSLLTLWLHSAAFWVVLFFPLHSHVLTRASDSVCAKGPPTQGSAPQDGCASQASSSGGANQYGSSDSTIQGCAKGNHEWPPCGLLNWMLFFINCSPVCIFNHQKGPGLGFSSVCVDHLDTNNCRRIP